MLNINATQLKEHKACSFGYLANSISKTNFKNVELNGNKISIEALINTSGGHSYVGSWAHKTLEIQYKKFIGTIPKITKDDLFKTLDKLANDNYHQTLNSINNAILRGCHIGVNAEHVFNEYVIDTKKCLLNYYETYLANTKERIVAIEEKLNGIYDSFTLTGKYDLLVERNNELYLVDYKFWKDNAGSKKLPKVLTDAINKFELSGLAQLGVYAKLLQPTKLAGVEVRVTNLKMSINKIIENNDQFNIVKYADNEIDRLINNIQLLNNGISHCEQNLNKDECKRCGVRTKCKAYCDHIGTQVKPFDDSFDLRCKLYKAKKIIL